MIATNVQKHPDVCMAHVTSLGNAIVMRALVVGTVN